MNWQYILILVLCIVSFCCVLDAIILLILSMHSANISHEEEKKRGRLEG